MHDTVRHPDPATFLNRAEPWLLEAEDLNNLILSLSYAHAARGGGGGDAFFGTVEHDGAVVGCVLCTPPYKVLTTEMPSGAAPSVAERLADAYEEIPAVLGPPEAAGAVAEAWVALRGGVCRAGMEQRLYRLDEVEPPRPVPGTLRKATPADLELAVSWGEGFARDAGRQFSVRKETVEAWIEGRHLYLWEDGGPRAITVAHGRTPNGIRVGYVYTPPEWRGRGYASACVAEVSQAMLDDGLGFCVLYTDLGNPTSNAIYQRLGYRPIADVRDYDIDGEDER